MLHPSYKLRYFEKAGWQDEWVKEAVGLVRTEFDDSYAAHVVPQGQVRSTDTALGFRNSYDYHRSMVTLYHQTMMCCLIQMMIRRAAALGTSWIDISARPECER